MVTLEVRHSAAFCAAFFRLPRQLSPPFTPEHTRDHIVEQNISLMLSAAVFASCFCLPYVAFQRGMSTNRMPRQEAQRAADALPSYLRAQHRVACFSPRRRHTIVDIADWLSPNIRHCSSPYDIMPRQLTR
jgi:hypothetical protein